MSAVDLQEREDRLTALVNVLGFTSLDHLEDFVVAHGSARVLPASAFGASSLSTLDLESQTAAYTQAGGQQSYVETGHAKRNEERRRENKALQLEVKHLRDEVERNRHEYERMAETIERAGRHKERLVAEIEDLTRKVDERILPHGGERSTTESQTDVVLAELAASRRTIDALDEQVLELEADLAAAWEVYEEEVVARGEDTAAWTEELDTAAAENERLRGFEAAYEGLQASLANLVRASPTATPSTGTPTQRSASATPSALRHSLNRPAPSQNAPTPHPVPRPSQHLRGPVPPSRASPCPGPSSARTTVPKAPSTLSRSIATEDGPEPSLRPTASPRDQAPVRPDAAPRAITSTAAVDPLTSLPPVASTSSAGSPRLTGVPRPSNSNPVPAAFLERYTTLRATYVKCLKSIEKKQAWGQQVIDNSSSRIKGRTRPPPPTCAYPSDEFPEFDPLPDSINSTCVLQGGEALRDRLEALEAKEQDAARRQAEWKIWIREVKPVIEAAVATPGSSTVPSPVKRPVTVSKSGNGTKRKGEGEGAKVLVKKRRRVSKEGTATPTASTSVAAGGPSPSSSLRRANAVDATRSSSPRRAPLPINVQPSPATITSIFGPVSPDRTIRSTVQQHDSTLSIGKKAWNLLSPKKEKAKEFVSRATISSNPARSPRAQVLAPDSPNEKQPSSDAPTSELEREPDTLPDSEENVPLSPATIRSSPRRRSASTSPTKRRRPSTTASPFDDLGRPKPPFSPSFAAASKAVEVETRASPLNSSQTAKASVRRTPLQPSPNRHSQTRSPSSSPSKSPSQAMPPAAQTGRKRSSPVVGRTEEAAPVRGGSVRGLLFSPEVTRAQERATQGSPVVKTEDVDDDPFVVAAAKGKSKAFTSSPRKKRRSDAGSTGSSVSSKTSKYGPGVPVVAKFDSCDQKPEIRDTDDDESSLGPMPMGSQQDEARKEWFRRLKVRRHERLVKKKAEQAEKAGSHKSPQVEINPDRNQGIKHAYKETERRKAVRQSMVAEACENCKA
ncbi:hypothetical protein JCM10212_000091, partial [Sporobolomyces blumeae]